eukprot:873851-Amphidinium_carterae.4
MDDAWVEVTSAISSALTRWSSIILALRGIRRQQTTWHALGLLLREHSQYIRHRLSDIHTGQRSIRRD